MNLSELSPGVKFYELDSILEHTFIEFNKHGNLRCTVECLFGPGEIFVDKDRLWNYRLSKADCLEHSIKQLTSKKRVISRKIGKLKRELAKEAS